MKLQTCFTFLSLLASAESFAPVSSISSSAKASTSSLQLSDLLLAESPSDIVNTIVPLTITASAVWSTIKQSSTTGEMPFFLELEVPSAFENLLITPAEAAVAEEAPAPVMEAAPVAVVDEKVQESAPEVAVPAMAVVETPVTPVVTPAKEEPVAPAVVAAVTEEQTTVVTPTKTSNPIVKSLAKLVTVICKPWLLLPKSLSRLLRFLYLPWIGMVPRLSNKSA